MNELKLTTEQRSRIAPWENHLHSALYADYVVALSSGAARDLFDVYNAVYHANEQNKYCSACVLNVCKRLGRLYFTKEVAEHVTSGIGPDDNIIVEKIEELPPTGAKTPASVKHTATEKKTPAKGKKGGKNGKK